MRRTVLVTRPEPDGGTLAEQLRLTGYDALATPLFETVLNPLPPPDEGFEAVIATSRNALRALLSASSQTLFHLPFYAVGNETAEAARTAGFDNIRIAAGNAQSLADLIIAEAPASRLLYLAGAKRKDLLEISLREAGCFVHAWEGYDMRPCDLGVEASDALHDRRVAAVLLFSERAALRFMRLVIPMGQTITNTPDYLCLSKEIAAPLQARGLRAFAPQQAGLDPLLALLSQKNIGGTG